MKFKSIVYVVMYHKPVRIMIHENNGTIEKNLKKYLRIEVHDTYIKQHQFKFVIQCIIIYHII